MASSAWLLVCGAIVLLAGIGYTAAGDDGGSGWLMLVGGVGMFVGALMMRRQRERSDSR